MAGDCLCPTKKKALIWKQTKSVLFTLLQKRIKYHNCRSQQITGSNAHRGLWCRNKTGKINIVMNIKQFQTITLYFDVLHWQITQQKLEWAKSDNSSAVLPITKSNTRCDVSLCNALSSSIHTKPHFKTNQIENGLDIFIIIFFSVVVSCFSFYWPCPGGYLRI